MATIKEIKEQLEEVRAFDDPLFLELELDTRAGVQKAMAQRKKAIQALIDEDVRLEQMLSYERKAYKKGYHLVAGIDEVGRGPLAGPVVAAAVILPVNCKIPFLNDSKKIPKSKHETIYQEVIDNAIAVGIGIKDNHVIDEVNIYEATKLAMLEAIEKLGLKPEALLIDAMKLDIAIPQESIIKGDANSLSIAAASIVAKVTRDKMMEKYNDAYPGYGFDKNAGYGTKVHLEGLTLNGITPIHRQSFEPIKTMLSQK